jgi:subtilisin family serine protease
MVVKLDRYIKIFFTLIAVSMMIIGTMAPAMAVSSKAYSFEDNLEIDILDASDEKLHMPDEVASLRLENGKIPVIITFKDKTNAAVVKAAGGDVKQEYTIIPAISANVPEEALYGLTHNPNIDFVEYDAQVYATEQTTPWGIEKVGATQVHSTYENTGDGINVAILDTGIDYNHPDLDENYAGGYDFVNNDEDPWDDQYHGTHCAGTVAAENNTEGVIGVAPDVNLYALKVLDSEGSGYYSYIISALEWAVENDIDVASMSLSGSSDYIYLRNACDEAYSNGVVLVAAAGNTGDDSLRYPAAYDSVIAVSATDSNNDIADFSSIGPQVELAAPGVGVYSTIPIRYSSDYYSLSGTSMATPHVTGVVALLLSADNSLTPDEVREILHDTATDLGENGKDDEYGYGLVNAYAAVNYDPSPDTENPIISSVDLSAYEPSAGDQITVIVNTTDNVGVTSVTAEDITLTKDGDDTWYGLIEVSEGLNYVNVSSQDAAGNIAWDNSTSYTTTPLDNEPPVISSVTLSNYTPNTDDLIDVTVVVTDNVGVTGVTADSVALTDQGSDTWTGTITAIAGTNTIHVFAQDNADNGAWNYSVSYTAVDTIAPIISSVTLSDDTPNTDETITVTVSVTDNVGVKSVTANEVALVNQSNIWTGTITAIEGTHTVEVIAKDEMGNTATDNSESYTATTPDTEKPIISSVTLSNYTPNTGDSITVTVSVTDNVGVKSVTANEVALVNQSNIWTGTITAIEGTHTVEVIAKDEACNTASYYSAPYEATTPLIPLVVNVEVTPITKKAGKNVFAYATATITVMQGENLVSGATVSGHWEGTTKDLDSATTDQGIVTVESDSGKYPISTLEFTFVVDSITIGGIPCEYETGTGTVYYIP